MKAINRKENAGFPVYRLHLLIPFTGLPVYRQHPLISCKRVSKLLIV